MHFEVLLVAAVLLLALWPLATRLRGAGPRPTGTLALALGTAAAAAALWAAFGYRASLAAVAERDVTQRPIAIEHDGYVSSSRCESCHPREYATWHASYHRTMTQVATPESVAFPVDGVELSFSGHAYRFEVRGNEIWARIRGPAEKEGDVGRVDERQIVLSTGSHHFQAYWFATGKTRKLGLFPLAYQIAEQRWIPMDALGLTPPGVHQAAPEGKGRWNRVCLRCHSTGPQPRLSTLDVMDTRVGEFGIACDACHGPGEQHVRLNRDPWRRYRLHLTDEEDPSAVQPERLAHRRSSQVCGQCHSVHSFHSRQDQREWADSGPPYRPGDELTETRRIVHRNDDPYLPQSSSVQETRFWSDGMPRVNGREYNSLLENPCFERGEMSCLSCHSMHPGAGDPRPLREWADDQLAPGMRGNRACTQCHADFEDAALRVAHTHHEAESSGSDCMNCHMPYTAYGLQKATRSHQIEHPTLQTSLATGRPNACNACHLDRTLAWAGEHLEAWYGTPAPALTDEQRRIAASVIWILSGDAGQRVLMAWHMGWDAAREASGSAWMPPYLAQLLTDPYAAVRSVAYRSLRSFEGFEDFAYDFTAPRAKRLKASQRAIERWSRSASRRDLPTRQTVLFTRRGGLQLQDFGRLVRQRDDRPLMLVE